MNKETLRKICVDQREDLAQLETGVTRQALATLEPWVKLPQILIVAGMRRVGKSTLLRQVMDRFYPQGNYYYLNFADERLIHFGADDFDALYDVFIELYGDHSSFFFDEIQLARGWDRFVRRLYERKCKVYVTGSNASLVKRDIGTWLTGRYLTIRLFPFSFKEYLMFQGVMLDEKWYHSTRKRGAVKRPGNGNLKDFFPDWKRQG